MTSDRASSTDASRKLCTHPRRVRENRWGWYGAETVCLVCGQSFDPGEEQLLRRGEYPAPTTESDRSTSWGESAGYTEDAGA
jgi:hypothetical protein